MQKLLFHKGGEGEGKEIFKKRLSDYLGAFGQL